MDGVNRPPSIKQPWDDAHRQSFIVYLIRAGWHHMGPDGHGADVYELHKTRLSVDYYGIFVFEQTPAGWWRRTFGLADDSIQVSQLDTNGLGPLYMNGDKDSPKFFLNLLTGDMVGQGSATHGAKDQTHKYSNGAMELFVCGLGSWRYAVPEKALINRDKNEYYRCLGQFIKANGSRQDAVGKYESIIAKRELLRLETGYFVVDIKGR